MVIQPSSAADNSDALAVQNFSHPKQNLTAQDPMGDATSERARGDLSIAEAGNEPGIDSATADQVTQKLAQTLLDSPALAILAHVGMPSQSVFDLLQ